MSIFKRQKDGKKVWTQKEIDELHYIPANHIFAFYLTGGTDGARAEYKRSAGEQSERMREEMGMDEGFIKAFELWYCASCEYLLMRLPSAPNTAKDGQAVVEEARLQVGKQVDQSYPKFVWPVV